MVLGNKNNTSNKEKFHLEEKESLIEMATLYKGEIIIEIYSNDHNPAHCHILDSNKNELNRVLIDGNCPKDKSDIKIYEGETMNMEAAERKFFINWVNLVDEDGISNWRNLQRTWQLFHNYKN